MNEPDWIVTLPVPEIGTAPTTALPEPKFITSEPLSATASPAPTRKAPPVPLPHCSVAPVLMVTAPPSTLVPVTMAVPPPALSVKVSGPPPENVPVKVTLSPNSSMVLVAEFSTV